jgi:CDP-diacylglycerol--glycerol-3-phosphate 3-phosphatidyltransferase
MANALTAVRVVLIFIVIAVWSRDRVVENVWLDLAMVPLLAWAIFMDALDGWAARKFREESKVGALFDIAGDRIVELALWTFFAIRRDASGEHFVAYWVPIVILTRTILTDMIRSAAFGEGKTAFGADGMQSSRWALQLTASRWSRGLYGGLKAVCFCALGLLLAWPYLRAGSELGGIARQLVDLLVYATVVFAIVRAVPVLWEGRRYVVPVRSAESKVHSDESSIAPQPRVVEINVDWADYADYRLEDTTR